MEWSLCVVIQLPSDQANSTIPFFGSLLNPVQYDTIRAPQNRTKKLENWTQNSHEIIQNRAHKWQSLQTRPQAHTHISSGVQPPKLHSSVWPSAKNRFLVLMPAVVSICYGTHRRGEYLRSCRNAAIVSTYIGAATGNCNLTLSWILNI